MEDLEEKARQYKGVPSPNKDNVKVGDFLFVIEEGGKTQEYQIISVGPDWFDAGGRKWNYDGAIIKKQDGSAFMVGENWGRKSV